MSDDEENIKSLEDDNVEEALPDWGLVSGKSTWKHDEQLPKRSEKYFDHDGSETQSSDLNRARGQMYDALLCIRGHLVRQILVAVWIPQRKMALVPHAKGAFFKDMGTAHVFKRKTKLLGMWLTPIETVYLTERGSLITYLSNDNFARFIEDDSLTFDYNSLRQLPMSYLYSLAFGGDPDLIDKYQVFALLKRLGYIVLEFQQYWPQLESWHDIHKEKTSLFSRAQSFFSLLGFHMRNSLSSTSFYSKHTHYFNYTKIFESLRLIPTYTAFETLESRPPIADPKYTLHFNVWKPTPSFSKKHPPPPDFQIVIANVAKTPFPSLSAIRSLWNQLNFSFVPPQKPAPKAAPGKKKKPAPPTKKELQMQRRKAREEKLDPRIVKRNNYLKLRDAKLKNGSTGRCVVLATIDSGIITFNSLNETEFSLKSQHSLKDLNAITTKPLHGVVWNEPIKL